MMKIVRGMMRKWVGVMTASVCLLAVSLFGCGRNERDAEVWDMMMHADGMMDSNPEMALEIMDSIDGSRLEGETLGRYALLMTKAENKNHIFQDNDSLIKIAADYYSGRGDSLEVQALYYWGYSLFDNDIIDLSLIPLTESYEKALKNEDYFYAAMSARALSYTYGEQMNYSKGLEWAKKAKRYFEKAGKPEHVAWMDIKLISSLTALDSLDEAKSILENIDRELFSSNKNFRKNILKKKIRILDIEKKDNEILDIYDTIQSDGHKMTNFDWLQMADSYRRLGNIDKMEESLNKIEGRFQYPDSLFFLVLKAQLLGLKAMYKEAYEAMSDAEREILKDGDRQIMNPANQLLANYIMMKYDNERLISERNEIRMWLLVVICLIILLVAAIVIRQMIVKIRENQDYSEALRLNIDALNKDLQYSRLQNESFGADIREILQQQVGMLNSLSSIYFRAGSISEKNRKEIDAKIKSIMNEFTSPEMLNNIISTIDKHDGGLITKFREAFPTLKEKHLVLVIYKYISFGSETIAMILGKKDLQQVYMDYFRLRRFLMKNGGEKSAEFIDKIGI